MVTFLVLFFPAVLSVWILDALTKGALSNRDRVYCYCANVLLVNLTCFALKRWILHSGDYPIDGMTPNSAMNYLLVAVFLSAVLAVVEYFCYKRVRIQVESNICEEEEKEDEEIRQ